MDLNLRVNSSSITILIVQPLFGHGRASIYRRSWGQTSKISLELGHGALNGEDMSFLGGGGNLFYLPILRYGGENSRAPPPSYALNSIKFGL